MAKLIDLVTFSGAVGDVVGCNGPFGFYLRSRPRKSAKPPTPRQLEARAKLALAMEFINPLRELIYLGMASQRQSSKTAAMNHAAAHIINHAVEGDYPDLTINPAQVQLSRGALLPLDGLDVAIQGGQLRVSWLPIVDRFNAFADDVAFAMAYNAQDKTVSASEALRHTGNMAVDVSAEPMGSRLLIYACVADRNHKRFSNSQFLGVVER